MNTIQLHPDVWSMAPYHTSTVRQTPERIGTPKVYPRRRQGMQDKPASPILVLAGRATRTRFTSAASYPILPGCREQLPGSIGNL
jgi:hypothetical protein